MFIISRGGYTAFYPGNEVKIYNRNDFTEFENKFTVVSGVDNIDDKTVEVKFKEDLQKLTPNQFVFECDCKDWYESGPCRNLEIFNNTFSKEDAVLIKPICIGKPVSDVHRNIKIYDNKIGE